MINLTYLVNISIAILNTELNKLNCFIKCVGLIHNINLIKFNNNLTVRF